MSEIPKWRKKIIQVGIILATVNPVYLILTIWIDAIYKLSAAAGIAVVIFILMVTAGSLMPIVALVCGVLGHGSHRWKVILGACLEISVWFFFSIDAWVATIAFVFGILGRNHLH